MADDATLKQSVYFLVSVAVVGYVAICVMMYVSQRSLIYYPQPRAVTAPESTLIMPVDSAEVVVTVRRLEGPRAIIYFGGNAEDVSQNLATFSNAFPDQALYLMHYRGYGGSAGQPTEKDNVADGIALFKQVRSLHTDIAIVGRSLGSSVAVQVASQVEASRLVLITPFDSIVELGAQLYPLLPVRLLAKDRYESSAFARQIKIPTTIIMAEHDGIIPRASTEKLLSRFGPGVARMTVIEGVGHNDLGWDKRYGEALQAALQ